MQNATKKNRVRRMIELPLDLHAILKAKADERDDKLLKVTREVIETGLRVKGWMPKMEEAAS